jgi:hypothetical protein
MEESNQNVALCMTIWLQVPSSELLAFKFYEARKETLASAVAQLSDSFPYSGAPLSACPLTSVSAKGHNLVSVAAEILVRTYLS